jgi:hypothetical protein
LDSLFEKPHMSAVNAGALMPGQSHWTRLNSGLMVIEPSRETLAAMVSRIHAIPPGVEACDQELINDFYPEWATTEALHLDPVYNVQHCDLDEYRKLGFSWSAGSRQIAIVHYIGEDKPWNVPPERFLGVRYHAAHVIRRLLACWSPRLRAQLEKKKSIRLWLLTFRSIPAQRAPKN